MKKIFAILSIGILILTGGCSNAAAAIETSSDTPVSSPESSMLDSSDGGTSDTLSRPSDIPRRDSQNEVLGKITAISENKITLAIGTMNIPEGMQGERGAPSSGDGSQPKNRLQKKEISEDGSLPDDARRDGPAPKGERSVDGNRKGSGGFPGGYIDLDYTGEEISYTLSDSVEIIKGIEKNSEKLTITSLTEGDVLRLVLDEAGQPVSLRVFEANKQED